MVAQNRSNLQAVERELKQIDKQRRMAQGNSKQLMEFLRKKLEQQTEKVVSKREKAQAIYKVYAKAQEELQKEERLKEQLIEELNSVVQQQALAHMQRLDQLEQHIRKINVNQKVHQSMRKNSKSSPMVSDLVNQNKNDPNFQDSENSDYNSSDTHYLKRQSSYPDQSREKQPKLQQQQKNQLESNNSQEGMQCKFGKKMNENFENQLDYNDQGIDISSDSTERKVHGGSLSRSQQDLFSLNNLSTRNKSYTQLQKLDESTLKNSKSFINVLEQELNDSQYLSPQSQYNESNTNLNGQGSNFGKSVSPKNVGKKNLKQKIEFNNSVDTFSDDQSEFTLSPNQEALSKLDNYQDQNQGQISKGQQLGDNDNYLDWDQNEDGGWGEGDGGWDQDLDLEDQDFQDPLVQEQIDSQLQLQQQVEFSTKIISEQINSNTSKYENNKQQIEQDIVLNQEKQKQLEKIEGQAANKTLVVSIDNVQKLKQSDKTL